MKGTTLKYGIVLGLCLQLFSFAGFAQSQYNFDHLTPEDGLSESTVLAITQDADGFIWFGTRGGLNRYDGRKVRVYRHEDSIASSISDNFVFAMLKDRRGRLWVGTRIGLNLLDPATGGFKQYYADSLDDSSVSNSTITCIYEDRDGRIWVGTRQGLNMLVDNGRITFRRFMHDPANPNTLMDGDVRSIFQDSQGYLWVGTPQGFSKLTIRDGTGFRFKSYRLPDNNELSSRSNSVNAIGEDSRGSLLIGTERKGLIFFDPLREQFSADNPVTRALDAKAVRSIHRTPAGAFWIGTIGGLFILSNDFNKIDVLKNEPDNPASITDNSIRSIFCDQHGTFWIGTYHGGVNIFSPRAKQFRYIDPAIGTERFRLKVASALTTDRDGNFWIGTEGNGLILADANSRVRMHFRHTEKDPNSLCHDNIKCLLVEDGL
ncbi:MAG TPA: two-component regulator propeller domain-containing protein, partial [Chryseosolibacter sp.]|nr:two-component regulator propeller domain-containing protein [Chryseosolibacter sp.]